MRFIILSVLSLSAIACSSPEKETQKTLPAPVVASSHSDPKPSFEKIQYISEFKQKDKVLASANLGSEEANISIKFINKDLPKGNYALLLIPASCDEIQKKHKSLQHSQINDESLIAITEFAAKKGLDLSLTAEAKGGISPKDYLTNRFLAIYKVSKKEKTYSFVTCESRQ